MIIFFFIVVLYTGLILWFTLGLSRLKEFDKKATVQKTSFSIVIPFRNEAKNINPLLSSLSLLKYPKDLVEILLVDDDSDDDSVIKINEFIKSKPDLDIKILKNKRKTASPKKDAIKVAIQLAKNDWIITTDADCIVPEQWLLLFDSFIQEKHPKLIAAGVDYKIQKGYLQKFQLLDFYSLQGSSMGAFGWGLSFMCNGANLAYEKQCFIEVKGFSGNDHIASGDDIFIMEKMTSRFPDQVHFLKNSQIVVTTHPQSSWKDLINQRMRWAAKITAYKSFLAKITGLIVFAMNLSFIILFILALLLIIPYYYLIAFIIIKLIIDYPILYKTAVFFKERNVLNPYLASALLYPFFNVYVALRSLFSSYRWKGRDYRK